MIRCSLVMQPSRRTKTRATPTGVAQVVLLGLLLERRCEARPSSGGDAERNAVAVGGVPH
jgi:hypothetical protein